MSPGRNTRRRHDTSGFTLIEVLVAFCVMATLLAVLYRGVVTMRQGAVAFDEHTDRELVARAVLDAALADRTLKPGTYHGTREGRRWTMIARNVDLRKMLPPPADTDAKQDAQGKPQDPTAAGQPAKADEETEAWATQSLRVWIRSPGLPLEIETIRLVRVGQ